MYIYTYIEEIIGFIMFVIPSSIAEINSEIPLVERNSCPTKRQPNLGPFQLYFRQSLSISLYYYWNKFGMYL